MDKVSKLIEETYEDYGEWIEMASDDEVVGILIRALASRVIKAEDIANRYKMAHKRRELM